MNIEWKERKEEGREEEIRRKDGKERKKEGKEEKEELLEIPPGFLAEAKLRTLI